MNQSSKFVAAIATAVLVSGLVSTAHGATSTQTVNFTPAVISSSVQSGGQSDPLTATFNKFNSSLGVLTSATFSYDYSYAYEATGTGGGSGTISGPFLINGVDATISGIIAGGAAPFSVSFVPATLNISSTSPVTFDNPLSQFTGSGTYTYGFPDEVDYSGGGPSGAPFLTVSLTAPSYDSVTYTYTPTAVPEPASLSLLGIGGLGLMGRRSRRVAH